MFQSQPVCLDAPHHPWDDHMVLPYRPAVCEWAGVFFFFFCTLVLFVEWCWIFIWPFFSSSLWMPCLSVCVHAIVCMHVCVGNAEKDIQWYAVVFVFVISKVSLCSWFCIVFVISKVSLCSWFCIVFVISKVSLCSWFCIVFVISRVSLCSWFCIVFVISRVSLCSWFCIYFVDYCFCVVGFGLTLDVKHLINISYIMLGVSVW